MAKRIIKFNAAGNNQKSLKQSNFIDNANMDNDMYIEFVGRNIEEIENITDYFQIDKLITPFVSTDNLKIIKTINFNPKVDIRMELANIMRRRTIFPVDDDVPVLLNCTSKGSFARDFKKVAVLEKINLQSQEKILELLKKSFPSANLPIHTSYNGKVISDIDKYCRDADNRTIKFDICPKRGCTVFQGVHINRLKCANGSCNAHRYRDCKLYSCRGKSYEDCRHNPKNKIAYKSIGYRPLLPLICMLLQFENFINLLKFKFEKPKVNVKYYDISDGEQYIVHMKQMEDNFKRRYNNEDNVKMINIILAQGYDGIQIFKKKYASFWPLLLQILNLPPSYRTKLGVGMFLMGIFTSKLGSNAEEFFFSDLYVNELKLLHEGILIDNKWFVQARLILSCLDTIAVQDHLHVQSVGSLEGCAICNCGEGRYVPIIKKVCTFGHRIILPIKNYIRSRGQSMMCCPENYYSSKDFKTQFEALQPVDEMISTHELKVNNNFEEFSICDKENKKIIYDFLNSEEDFQFFHEDCGINPTTFDKYLYYHHCDYRPQKQHVRMSNADYIEFGLSAKNINEPVHGIKDVWPEAALPYVDVETQVCWDPFHVMSNIALKILEYFKNDRMKPKIVRFCEATHSHPSLYGKMIDTDGSIFAPWTLSKLTQRKVVLIN
jgi:hypothetical protein